MAEGESTEEGTGEGTGEGAAHEWMQALPENLQSNASLGRFSSVEALAGGYVNARNMIGKDTIVVPQTADEYSEVYGKLGRPETSADYTLTAPEDIPEDAIWDDDTDNALRETMHTLGLSQTQAAGLNDFLYGLVQNAEQASETDVEANQLAVESELKREFGAAFEQKLNSGKRVVSEFGSEEVLELFQNPAFGNNAAIIRMFAKIGDAMLGDTTLIQGDGESTPSDLKEQINELQGHAAFLDKKHPEHTNIVKKRQILFEKLHAPAG